MEETLGERLRRLRNEQGWSLSDAAKRADMSPWALSLLERRTGLGKVRALSLKRVALLYGVTVDYLIRGVSDEEPMEAADAALVGA